MIMTGKKIYNSDGRSSEDKALDKFAEMMMRKSRLCRMTGRSLGLQINPSPGREIFLAANTME